MAITYDLAKRERTLRERKLDFADAVEVFKGWTLDIPDRRRNYGEPRVNTVGYLRGRMVMCAGRRAATTGVSFP